MEKGRAKRTKGKNEGERRDKPEETDDGNKKQRAS